MKEIEQKLLEFSTFLEENEKELTKAYYGSCLEDIYGQVTEIIDNQAVEPYDTDLEFYDDQLPDNEDD